MLTWRHIKCRATAEISCDFVSGCKTEVSKFDRASIISHQNILRLKVPMEDSNGMTVLNSIQELEKGMFGQSIITDEMALFRDVGEEITLRAILHHNICAFWAVQNSLQGNHVGMLASLVVKSNLGLLEATLPGIQSMFGESLYCVELVGVNVDSSIDDTISSDTEDRDQFELVCQDTAKPIFWCQACCGLSW